MLRFSNRRHSVAKIILPAAPQRRLWRLVLALMSLMVLVGCAQRARPIPSAPPPRAIPISAEAAQRLSERFAAALAQPGPFQIAITEEELASYLALNAGEGPLKDISLWLTEQGAYLSAKIELGRRYPLAAQVTVISEQGRPRLRLVWLTVAGRSMPRWIQASLEHAFNDALADAHLPLRLEEIRWGEGNLTLVGTIP